MHYHADQLYFLLRCSLLRSVNESIGHVSPSRTSCEGIVRNMAASVILRRATRGGLRTSSIVYKRFYSDMLPLTFASPTKVRHIGGGCALIRIPPQANLTISYRRSIIKWT